MSNLTLSKDGCRASEREEYDALDVFKLTTISANMHPFMALLLGGTAAIMTFLDLSVLSCINLSHSYLRLGTLSLHLVQAKQSLCTKKPSSNPSAVAIPVDNIMRYNFGAATIPVSSNAFFSWTRPKLLAAMRESSLWSGTSIRIEMLHLHGKYNT